MTLVADDLMLGVGDYRMLHPLARRRSAHLALIALGGLATARGGGLNGSWDSGCITPARLDNGSADPTSGECRSFTFDGQGVTQVRSFYSGSTSCAGSPSTTTYIGTYRESAATVAEATNLDLTYTSPTSLNVFDVYRIDGGRLFFGDINTGTKTSAQTRPIALGLSIPFTQR